MGLEALRLSLLEGIGHTPTEDQKILVERLSEYLLGNHKDLFILRGYAGTGKTTVLSAVVRCAQQQRQSVQLMAPTGRAAKVMSLYSGQSASTLHRRLYQVVQDGSGSVAFLRTANKRKNTWYIVDEASMISGVPEGSIHVLQDLLEYVFEGDNNKLILVGDVAQLPPVGSDLSPALVPRELRDWFGKRIAGCELKQVVRQAGDSGILEVATQLRMQVDQPQDPFRLRLPNTGDVHRVSTAEMLEVLESVVGSQGEDAFAVLCLSNQQANRYNQAIRSRILYRTEPIESGDRVMIVKNNYHWLEASQPPGFVANGDRALVERIGRFEEQFGTSFCEASLALIDTPQQHRLDATLNLQPLQSASAGLTQEEAASLYAQVRASFPPEMGGVKLQQAMREDPYLQALQVKFAYAITGHKAQGGQWPVVFVDASFLEYRELDKGLYRWLYTAVTRSTETLYLVNWPEQFLEE